MAVWFWNQERLKKPSNFVPVRMYITLNNFGDLVKLGLDWEGSVAHLQHLYYLGSSPQGFLSSQKGFSVDPTGRLCATFGTFGILSNDPS